MIWKCAYCGYQQTSKPDRSSCPNCGLVLAGEHTLDKYDILRKYCYPLSLIMRNQGYEHYFIDACAGSGKVQHPRKIELIDGSPLIMAKTREVVEEKIRDKTKEPQVECVFIEYNNKTFSTLARYIQPYLNFCKLFRGDCNVLLDKILNRIDDAFTFVFIDPFGLGDPVIRHETLEKVLKRRFTELFVHFSWEGVSRVAGWFKHLNNPDPRKRRQAQSFVETLDKYMTPEWQKIEEQNLPPNERKLEYVELYKRVLGRYYRYVEYIEIPIGSKNPIYYLYFTTRNKTGHKIMKNIIENKRRRGVRLLDEFF